MSGQISSKLQGQTLVLTISNPGARNALSPGMYAAAVEALNVASDSDGVRTVVFSGEGDTFCVGGQLQRLQANRELPPEVQEASVNELHAWIEAMRSFPKPVFAAIEGVAAGAGFSIALACDLLVASNSAVFSMAYSNVGLSPDGGASWQLTRMVPRPMAAEMMLGGAKYSSSRLHQLGIVNRLCAPGEALRDALAWAAEFNLRAPNAMESIKILMNQAESNTLSEHLNLERQHFVTNLHNANTGEGIAAFLQKRPAAYR